MRFNERFHFPSQLNQFILVLSAVLNFSSLFCSMHAVFFLILCHKLAYFTDLEGREGLKKEQFESNTSVPLPLIVK